MPHDMVTFQHSAPPAHIAANPPPVSLNANAQAGIRLAFPVVSIEGRRWSVTHRGVETIIQASPGFDVNGRPLPEAPVSALNVIVVGISAAISKSWYAQAFRPGVKILMPDCFSTNGETPNPQSPMMQSTKCHGCPKNEFESAIGDDGKPGKGKACRDGKKIAVVPAGDVKNINFGGIPMMLRLPVMSMPNLARYCGELSISRFDISQVVTSMSFSEEAKYPEVVFHAVDYIQNPADYSAVQDWMRSDIVRQMLDEAPTFENTGVSPVQPIREQFHIPDETRSAFIIQANERLEDELMYPDRWLVALGDLSEAASSTGELTELFALAGVRSSRENAPLAVRQQIQGMLDAAVDRLSPRDDPPPPTTSPEPSTPSTPPAPTEPSSERDSAGVAWDAALHASTKAKKADGTWRARRGAEPAQTTGGAPSTPQWDSDHAGQEPERADPPAGLAGKQPAPPATPTGFEAWLVDAEGDPIADEAGDLSAYRNPIEFVKHYLTWLDEQTPETHAGYVSANQKGIVAAQIASMQVSRLLADHKGPAARSSGDGPTLPMDMPVDQAVVPAPAKMSKADIEQYLGQLRVKLSSATTVDSAVHLGAANRVVFGKFPIDKYRLASEGIVADRIKDLTPPAKGTTETPRGLADRLLSDIASLTSLEACGAWLAMPAVSKAMDSLYHDALPMADEVTRALTAKRAEFAPTTRTPRQIADDLITAVKGCRTFKEVKGLAAIPKNVTNDDFLEKNHPDLWAEVRAVVDLQRRNLPEG